MTPGIITKVSLAIPFSTPEVATLVKEVLNVDKELKSSVSREISTKDETLLIMFYGADLKKLRVAVNSIIKNILLIVKTIKMFPM